MSRVEALIDRVMAEHPGLGVTAQARYYEDVHQHLAPLARELERENEQLRATIKGVRVDGDKVIIAVKGGNDAARWLCGELLRKHPNVEGNGRGPGKEI